MSNNSDQLEQILTDEGYFNLKIIEGRGMCGLFRFIFTVGLCYGCDEYNYAGRYCFDTLSDAVAALETWDGIGDPDADWIKHKGKVEYSKADSLLSQLEKTK